MSENKQDEQLDDDKKIIDINYIKSNLFRVIHVDGVFGGVSPTGQIHASVFPERLPIPQVVRQEVKDNRTLGGEVSRVGRPGVVREAEADLVLSKEVAVIIRNWLSQKIGELENAIQNVKAHEKD